MMFLKLPNLMNQNRDQMATNTLGTSALHLSIAYRNTELTELLCQQGANINQKASGNFFMPTDQQPERNLCKKTDFSGENKDKDRQIQTLLLLNPKFKSR